MRIDPLLEEVLASLTRLDGGRYGEVEVFAKKGRSRRVEKHSYGTTSFFTHEAGWAVRAGHRRGSFSTAGTGLPSPGGPWPEADGDAIRLPEPSTAPPWSEPAEFNTPLMGEREALALLEGVEQALKRELPGARLLGGAVEDGASEVQIVNSHGIRAQHRNRLASLYLEVAGPRSGIPTASIYLAEREARRFNPIALARRLGDRLLVLQEGKPRGRDRGEFLLAPPVMVHILEGLLPLFSRAEGRERIAPFLDALGRIGSEAVTLLDNGRLAGGVLEAPVDGEGVATREVVIVDRGTFRQPLVPWFEAVAGELRAAGCSRRPSWRDLPQPGPTHLYLRPRSGVSVGSLLEDVTRGYYLIEASGGGLFDLRQDRFSLPVYGFELRAGRAMAPVAGCHLCGSLSGLLKGIQALARDLTFLPRRGMLGSPTALVSGLELRDGL